MSRQEDREHAVDVSQQHLRDIAIAVEQVKTKLSGIELDLFAVKNAVTEWKPTVELARDLFAAGKVARWVIVAIIGTSLAIYSAWGPIAKAFIKMLEK